MIQARTLARLRLSAASGLVVDGGGFWVVADDLPALHRYDLAGGFVQRLALDGGMAKVDRHLPKAIKPDLEALLRLPDGTLLVLGSGSRPQRCRGYRVDGALGVTPVDLSALYVALAAELPALNIEGAVVQGGSLMLAHRGNSTGGTDALIELDLALALADLEQDRLGAAALRAVRSVQLGMLGGTRLTLTDLATHPDGTLWFSAAAEATADAYQDGAIRGSVIGRFDADGGVAWQDEVAPVCKIEGLHWLAQGHDGDRWLAVADADDPQRLAPLLALQTPA